MVGNYTELDNQAHIIFFTPGFPEDEKDSLCIPALQLFFKAFAIVFTGKISIVAFQYPSKKQPYYWNGIKIYPLNGDNKKWKKYTTWKKAQNLVKQLNNELKVTRIHSFWMGECALIASKLAHQHSIPHHCTLMGQDALPNNRHFKKIKHFPKLIVLSKFHLQQLKDHYNLNAKTIPWGTSSDNSLLTIDKSIDLIAVSSLIPLKCLDQFIEVVHRLKPSHPSIHCKIIGEGPLRKTLLSKIEGLELTHNIELMGLLPYSETQHLIAKSKVLFHPSSYESFGMVTIEALALNTTVIAKSVGIAAEINQVIKVKTTHEAVEKIKTLLNSKTEVHDQFPIENTVNEYLKLFNE